MKWGRIGLWISCTGFTVFQSLYADSSPQIYRLKQAQKEDLASRCSLISTRVVTEDFGDYVESRKVAANEGADTVHISREIKINRISSGLFGSSTDEVERYLDLYVCSRTVPQRALQKTGSNKLLRVLVFPYANTEKLSHYDWLAQSIPGAITIAMGKRFKYEAIKPNNVRAPQNGQANKNLEGKCDLYIEGGYRFDKEKDKLIIQTFIRDPQKTEPLAVYETPSPVDGRLFSATDLIATDIIGFFLKMPSPESP